MQWERPQDAPRIVPSDTKSPGTEAAAAAAAAAVAETPNEVQQIDDAESEVPTPAQRASISGEDLARDHDADTANQELTVLDFANRLAPDETKLSELPIPAPKTPPPPTPSDSPIPSTISTNPRALLERIHSGNASAQAGLNLAQLLHPFHSSSTTQPSPPIQPYVRAMFAGRKKFEALQTAAIVRAEEEGLNETRRCASVPLDWSMLNLLELEAADSSRSRAPTLPPLPAATDAHSGRDRAPTLPGLSPIVFRRHLKQVLDAISPDVSQNGKHLYT